jgi:hypothetical protein
MSRKVLTNFCGYVKLTPMKEKHSPNPRTPSGKTPAAKGALLAQLITITDLTLRNSTDTQEQKEALALKELLESRRAA